MSALYGAAGVKHDPELTRVLLEAGADPDDGESLYHAAYAESADCVRVLLEHGASVVGTNAVAAAIDGDHVEHVRLMLEADGDPNDGALVVHAVRRGCGAPMIELLAEKGADVDRTGGETWRGDVPLRTPYQHAVLRGNTELAELLERLGASTDVDPGDAWVARLARGEEPEGEQPRSFDVDMQEVVILTGLRVDAELVARTVGRRLPRSYRGLAGRDAPPPRLLARVGSTSSSGCSPSAPTRRQPRDADFDTPLDWVVHGSQHHGVSDRDYVGIAERLVAAGAPPVAKFPEAAEGPLAEWLQRMSIASPNE